MSDMKYKDGSKFLKTDSGKYYLSSKSEPTFRMIFHNDQIDTF